MLKKSIFIMLVILHVFAFSAFAQTQKADDGGKSVDISDEKISYAIGYFYYQSVQKEWDEIDYKNFLQGIKDCEAGTPVMDEAERKAALQVFKRKIMQRRAQDRQKMLDDNKAAGAAFLEKNSKKEGVVTLESGLQYKIIKEGEGETPDKDDTVKCNYKGYTIDGDVFDSSYRRGEPATFKLNGVIKGWTEALQLMKPGGKWKIFVPPALAYGDRGAGNAIEPGSTLIFEVELISVEETDSK